MNASFYQEDGALLLPQGLCRGPWSYDHQHGGPPAALLCRALERWGEDSETWVLTRLTTDLFRPIPLRPCVVEVHPGRLGRRVQRLEGTLRIDGEILMSASALRVRRTHLDLPPPPPVLPDPTPSSCPRFSLDFFPWEEGYHQSFEGRLVRGTWGQGPLTLWTRLLADLVEGEAPSPWQRTVVIADAESGIAPPLDPASWWFLNPDLTLVLEREPLGPWIGLEAESRVSPIGTGVSESRLFDEVGTFGRSAQTLVVQPAPTPPVTRLAGPGPQAAGS